MKATFHSLLLFLGALVLSSFALWAGMFIVAYMLGHELPGAYPTMTLLIFIPTYLVLATISKTIDFFTQSSDSSHYLTSYTSISLSMISAAIVSYVFPVLRSECVVCSGNGLDMAFYTLAIGVPHAIIHNKVRDLLARQ